MGESDSKRYYCDEKVEEKPDNKWLQFDWGFVSQGCRNHDTSDEDEQNDKQGQESCRFSSNCQSVNQNKDEIGDKNHSKRGPSDVIFRFITAEKGDETLRQRFPITSFKTKIIHKMMKIFF